jgi:hypothetical protein
MKISKLIDWAYLAFLVLTPVILLILPANYFNDGPTLCPSMRFFQVECPGCGMTRAIMHLIHFDFDSAAYYNMWSFIVAPVFGIYWIIWTRQAIKKVQQPETAVVA